MRLTIIAAAVLMAGCDGIAFSPSQTPIGDKPEPVLMPDLPVEAPVSPVAGLWPSPAPITPVPAEVPADELTELPTAILECRTGGHHTLAGARAEFAQMCPAATNRDCDPLLHGWTCSTEELRSTPVVRTEPSPPEVVPVEPVAVKPVVPAADKGLVIALHYDTNGTDSDDWLAAVAARQVIDRTGVEYTVLNGAVGRNGKATGETQKFNTSSRPHFRGLFPNHIDASVDGWLDKAVTRYSGILNEGKQLAIAEGGPSDCTADILRGLQALGHDTRAIRVIQHSAGYNVRNTHPSNLAFVLANANFIEIGDGNNRNGRNASTADLNDSSSEAASVIQDILRDSEYSRYWYEGMTKLPNRRKLDFSDTVELLFLIKDGKTKTTRDFYNRYVK